MPLLNRNGHTVDYTDEGTGPAVVMLHGSFIGNRQWRRLIGELSPHFRCLAPNLLGYGQTSPWPGRRRQTLDDATAIALAVCGLADEPIRIVGHSWGGGVALVTAHQLGPRVAELVLYEPMIGGLLAGHQRDEAAQAIEGLYAAVRTHCDARDWTTLAQIFTDYFNGEGSWHALAPERQRAMVDQTPPNCHEWDAGMPPITADRLRGITAHTLVMRGSETPFVLREITEVLLQAFPQWELREIAGAGHPGPLTHGGPVNDHIRQWFGAGGVAAKA